MNQPHHHELQPPLIAGYRDLTLIARGGFSSVYKAYQDTFSRMVAIKVLHTDAHDPAAQQQFQHECQLTGRLTGRRNIITVFDAGITLDQRPYIAMQYLPSGSLADRLAADGPLPVGDVLDIGAAIAGALDAANSAGILHRDVKPGNILVSDDGEPVLSDFGIASLADPTGDPNSVDAFTVAHTAPEVLEGAPASVRSDIYALGSTLYTLLAGLPPFGSHSGQTTMYRVLEVRRTRLPEFEPLDLPAGVAALLRRTLAADPEQRPSTFAELAAELAALRDDPNHVADPSPPTTPAAGTVVVAERPAAANDSGQALVSPFDGWGNLAAPQATPFKAPRPTLPNDQLGARRTRRVGITIAVTATAAVLVAGVVIASTVLRPQATGQALGQPSASGSVNTSLTTATPSTTAASGTAAASDTSPNPGASSEAAPGANPNGSSPGAGNAAPGQQAPAGSPAGQGPNPGSGGNPGPGANPGSGGNPGPPPPPAPGPNPGPGCNFPGSTFPHNGFAIGSSAPWVCGEVIWFNESIGVQGTMRSQNCSAGQKGTETVLTASNASGTGHYSTGAACGSTSIKHTLGTFDDGRTSPGPGGFTKLVIDFYSNGQRVGHLTCMRDTKACS